MTTGKIGEGFNLLPSISINWYSFKGEKHYYLFLSWLFWYVSTLDKFKWEEE